MKQQEEKKKKWYRFFLNKYLITGILFLVWMFFFDQNSYLIHKELDQQIVELKQDKKNYNDKLDKENDRIDKMKKDSGEIERVAREKHFLKKEDEDVFIIEKKKVKIEPQ